MLPDSGLTWTNEQTSAGKYQFTSGSYTRLNTDLELVYDLSLNSDDASCSCTVGTDCDLADSYDLVQTYANVSTQTFLRYFWVSFRPCILCVFHLVRMLILGQLILLQLWTSWWRLVTTIWLNMEQWQVLVILPQLPLHLLQLHQDAEKANNFFAQFCDAIMYFGKYKWCMDKPWFLFEEKVF